MKNLWSIRMRASKKLITPMGCRRRSSLITPKEIHISGAEGLYRESEVVKVVKKYIERALNHPRGKADKIVITIEEIREKPKKIPALPLVTIENSSPTEGEKIARKLLQSEGISGMAVDRTFELIKKGSMRGAAIITAAKVSSCNHVIAELCVSDDPNYTTGYVASKGLGYVRIPHIKSKGNRRGGRAFFVKEGTGIRGIIEYLERRPVIIGKVCLCRGIISFDEILNRTYI